MHDDGAIPVNRECGHCRGSLLVSFPGGTGKRMAASYTVLTARSLCFFNSRSEAESFFHRTLDLDQVPSQRVNNSFKEIDIPGTCCVAPQQVASGKNGEATLRVLPIFESPTMRQKNKAWLTLASAIEEELEEWARNIVSVAEHVRTSLMGYMHRRVAGVPLENMDSRDPAMWAQVYATFLPKKAVLYFHVDHWHSHELLSSVQIEPSSKIEKVNPKVLSIHRPGHLGHRSILALTSAKVASQWFSALSCAVIDSANLEESPSLLQVALPPTPPCTVVKEGYILIRSPSDPHIGFARKTNYLKLFEDGTLLRFIDSTDFAHLQPSLQVSGRGQSFIFPTSYSQCSFLLLDGEYTVVHMEASTPEEAADWIASLEKVNAGLPQVLGSQGSMLEKLASQLDDEYYEVEARSKLPLGLTLENVQQTPIVIASNSLLGSVTKGSALVSINRVLCMGVSYSAAIQKLTYWAPPLRLGFIRAPKFESWVKLRRDDDAPTSRYMILKSGLIQFYGTDQVANAAHPEEMEDTLEEVHLRGAQVCLDPPSWDPAFLSSAIVCRVVAGLSVFSLKAKRPEETLMIAARIRQAWAIAQGGAYLVRKDAFWKAQLSQEVRTTPVGAKSDFSKRILDVDSLLLASFDSMDEQREGWISAFDFMRFWHDLPGATEFHDEIGALAFFKRGGDPTSKRISRSEFLNGFMSLGIEGDHTMFEIIRTRQQPQICC